MSVSVICILCALVDQTSNGNRSGIVCICVLYGISCTYEIARNLQFTEEIKVFWGRSIVLALTDEPFPNYTEWNQA